MKLKERTRIRSRDTAAPGESEGLRFLKRVAEVICYECDVTHTFAAEPGAYVITVSGKGDALTFYFDRADVDDIDGESFRLAAMRFLERCLKTFGNQRVH
jgi:hypothetical protein